MHHLKKSGTIENTSKQIYILSNEDKNRIGKIF